MKVHLLGGKYDGFNVFITKTPPKIRVGNQLYERIDDPETGDPLGAYVALTEDIDGLRATWPNVD